MTILELKSKMEARGSKFWTEDTMRFFGDTLQSFGLRRWNDRCVLYRKPGVPISVFGEWTKASPALGYNAWFVTGKDCTLVYLTDEETEQFYNSLPNTP